METVVSLSLFPTIDTNLIKMKIDEWVLKNLTDKLIRVGTYLYAVEKEKKCDNSNFTFFPSNTYTEYLLFRRATKELISGRMFGVKVGTYSISEWREEKKIVESAEGARYFFR